MKYMLDTNMCIYAQKSNPNVLSNIYKHKDEGLSISAITLAELQYGIEASIQRERNTISLMKFLSAIEVLPFTDTAAEEYGKICCYLRKSGTPIGTMDMLIAAHAKAEDLIIVTNNVREFERVKDLKIENWYI
jgi:tRNA(fMet)-specific endonuclease VapC